MKVIQITLSVLMSMLIALLVFEGGLRLLGMGPVDTLNEYDPVLGWSKKPGVTVTRGNAEGFDVQFEFNQQGLRDDAEAAPANPQSDYRVIALGDSFTLGVTVERSDLFVDQLENWWNQEGRNVQIINTGTEGYSTDQEVAWLETHGAAYAPDLVLLFAYENDLYWNGQTRYTDLDKPRYQLDGSPEVRELVRPAPKGPLASSAIGKLLSPSPDSQVELFQPGSVPLPREMGALIQPLPEFMRPALDHTTGAMRALARVSEDLETEVIVIPIPSHSAVDDEYRKGFGARMGLASNSWSPDQPIDLLLAAARDAGLATLDVRTHLRANQDRDLFFHTDWHLNPEGNRVFTAALHTGLEGLVQLPAANAPCPQPAPSEPARSMPNWLPLFVGLWAGLGSLYARVYRTQETVLASFLKVGAMLTTIFSLALGAGLLLDTLTPSQAQFAALTAVVCILGFVAYKLGNRLSTILELLGAFIGRGHWYLMPLVTVLLTVGSLLVVAASSPLVAPFIYTLF